MKYILSLLTALIMLSCSDDATTNTTPIIGCGNMPVGVANSDSLRIIAIMPNPDTPNDDYGEYFVVKNYGKYPISLSNFYIQDKDGTKWNFTDKTINECDTLKLVSDKTAQLLNSGDEVSLYNSFNVPIQTVSYTDAKNGVEIRFDK